MARIVLPGIPQHVTQRGSRRASVFFEDDNHAVYMDLPAEVIRWAGTADCRMSSHIHQVLLLSHNDGLRVDPG
ncbi:MAG: hypothetical protein KDE22_09555 [Rhodobacterales bacterium]|nr:hypothetical protein [Rhodobacterales bacterium]